MHQSRQRKGSSTMSARSAGSTVDHVMQKKYNELFDKHLNRFYDALSRQDLQSMQKSYSAMQALNSQEKTHLAYMPGYLKFATKEMDRIKKLVRPIEAETKRRQDEAAIQQGREAMMVREAQARLLEKEKKKTQELKKIRDKNAYIAKINKRNDQFLSRGNNRNDRDLLTKKQQSKRKTDIRLSSKKAIEQAKNDALAPFRRAYNAFLQDIKKQPPPKSAVSTPLDVFSLTPKLAQPPRASVDVKAKAEKVLRAYNGGEGADARYQTAAARLQNIQRTKTLPNGYKHWQLIEEGPPPPLKSSNRPQRKAGPYASHTQQRKIMSQEDFERLLRTKYQKAFTAYPSLDDRAERFFFALGLALREGVSEGEARKCYDNLRILGKNASEEYKQRISNLIGTRMKNNQKYWIRNFCRVATSQ